MSHLLHPPQVPKPFFVTLEFLYYFSIYGPLGRKHKNVSQKVQWGAGASRVLVCLYIALSLNLSPPCPVHLSFQLHLKETEDRETKGYNTRYWTGSIYRAQEGQTNKPLSYKEREGSYKNISLQISLPFPSLPSLLSLSLSLSLSLIQIHSLSIHYLKFLCLGSYSNNHLFP
jgi:hypothetical protein